MAQIDEKYLKGLKLRSSKRQPGEQGERDVHKPTERALKPEDVLSVRETETHVFIVAADGQKHEVAK
jgi:hypothetical protein